MKNKTQDPVVIQNCNFSGVTFDANVVETISQIAEGLTENAKALGHLAATLHASNVSVGSLLTVGAGAELPLSKR